MNRNYISGLVSVLVPCYNGSAYIKRFFDFLNKQTYPKIELILVNDGSTDNSDKLIRAELDCLMQKGFLVNYITQENRGLGGAINRAIKAIQGEYFVWVNIDDILGENFVKSMVDFLNKNPEYALVRSDFYISHEDAPFTVKGRFNDHNPEAAKPDLFENAILEKNFSFGASMLRTAVFDEVNPTREIYESRKGQNWQLLLPILYHHKSGYINQPLYTVVVQSESTSVVSGYEKRLEQMKEHENIILKTLAQMDMPPEERTRYEEVVRLRYMHNQFRLAQEFGDYALLKKCVCNLKQKNDLNPKEKRAYMSPAPRI